MTQNNRTKKKIKVVKKHGNQLLKLDKKYIEIVFSVLYTNLLLYIYIHCNDV